MIDWSKTKESGEASLDRRVHRRRPSSSEKRTQFMEECDGDAACVRGKMRDWRKAKEAGEASLDRGTPAAQFAKECNYDMACIRRKLENRIVKLLNRQYWLMIKKQIKLG